MKNKTIGIILSAGLSIRMKKNKAILKYNNKTFLEIIIEKLFNLEFQKVILVLSEQKDIQNCLNVIKNYTNLITTYNKNPERGITSSIKVALTKLNTLDLDYDSVMFFVVDQPLLSENTILNLLNHKKENSIIVPRANKKCYNPVIFSKKFLNNFFDLEGDIGGKQIIKKNQDSIVYVDFNDEKEFQDIDTPEEFYNMVKM